METFTSIQAASHPSFNLLGVALYHHHERSVHVTSHHSGIWRSGIRTRVLAVSIDRPVRTAPAPLSAAFLLAAVPATQPAAPPAFGHAASPVDPARILCQLLGWPVLAACQIIRFGTVLTTTHLQLDTTGTWSSACRLAVCAICVARTFSAEGRNHMQIEIYRNASVE